MRRLTLPKGSWTFFRQWLRNPARMAAVAPSGRDLAAAMVTALPEGARRVIELGGGTGAITRALLARGILGRELMVLELNEELHAHLRTRFPQVRIVLGDARDLVQLATGDGYLADGPADAIVSGLGFLSMPRDTQLGILQASFECLREGGRFLQFTYGPQSPVAAEVVEELGLEVERGEFVLLNVPPATVYVISRRA
ncbi:methyltransferase domain-containing protein [Lysobacter arenosi]|jgi:phosphatidylethanolamine/phosphatidyl-N-methylethanolamine N-methyltransferase|uniref:Methyltransferase domain-containing protein n=1 Tax=Lysobacter arenosi TaxID=2795387 RepID=A0ABX7REA6_9GAMM|nr:methyltransferase domain-containing protein [Lysobacter arenosi]QSX75282.1 methyltransferase domain-containing protein [Lysobacter arenosi]